MRILSESRMRFYCTYLVIAQVLLLHRGKFTHSNSDESSLLTDVPSFLINSSLSTCFYSGLAFLALFLFLKLACPSSQFLPFSQLFPLDVPPLFLFLFLSGAA